MKKNNKKLYIVRNVDSDYNYIARAEKREEILQLDNPVDIEW